MIPLKDTIRARTFPLVNWIFILANGLVFYHELSLSPSGLERFILHYGLVPANLNWSSPATLYPILTHMFIHSGWLHILSNMWVLFIFGDNVEDRLGSGRYFFFYILGGIAAGLMQTFIDPTSQIPAIGASGAIAAVLGAYFVFYPRARVKTFILLIIIPWFVDIPAFIFIGIWFVLQLFSGLTALSTPNSLNAGGVAWWAHIGGFLFGLLLAYPFLIGKQVRRWPHDEYLPK